LSSQCKSDGILSIGKIIGAHGLGGNLKVYSYAESPSLFRSGTRIFLNRQEDQQRRYVIDWVKPHHRFLLISLKGITTRDLAQALTGEEIFIEKAVLPDLGKDEYYWFDIIGLAVYTHDDAYLGKVESVIPTGGNDVFVVKKGELEILIPALSSVVIEMDLKGKLMRVKLPEGL